uniref:programmed cell death protein 2-like isoform X1 n=1 Tax=Styela clava TaxID=7725 RepID=UPI001939677C|nr:programmed cell death protein 2-like isoform X1 [Styela clava]XP_039264318.1 programmed cell death protein 2-like isoform X2 [Styela clava]
MAAMATSRNQVLLGVLDEKIGTTTISLNVNRVGGRVNLNQSKSVGTVVPSCVLCGDSQILVTHLYCPLDVSSHHRILCVFSCSRSSCWSKSKGWTVLRILISDKNSLEIEKSTNVSEEVWGDGDENEWGDGDETEWGDESDMNSSRKIVAEEKDVSTKLSQMKISNNHKNIISCKYDNATMEHPSKIYLPAYYINVYDETECVKLTQKTKKGEQNYSLSSDEMKQYADFASGKCTLNPESYERTEQNDKLFYKFWKTNQICPEQIIRYCHGGTPLHAKKSNDKIPICPDCGSLRVYEMQLMPALLPCLQTDSFSLEFSTVLVYTCSKNCSNDGDLSVKKEYLIYQDDPDLSYFKGQKQCTS